MNCVYGCKKDGKPCPRPHTCHTLGPKLASQRAIDEQAKTDRQACCTGNCRQGRNCTEQASSSWNLIDLVVIVGAVAIIGLVLAPYAAGYLSHMRG